MRTIVWVAVMAAACGGDKTREQAPPAPAPAPARDAAASAAPAPTPPAATPTKAPPPSAEERAAYRKHLRQGRALEKKKEWKRAVTELEAALVAIPNDGRALSELGWVAFQAGDYERAARANAASVKYSAEARVKAASLYNLGRVAEAVGKTAEAAEHYQASLRLRPGNKVVTRQLARLGSKPPDVGTYDSKTDCTESMPRDQLCPCHARDFGPGPDSEVECDLYDTDVPGFAYVAVSGSESYDSASSFELAARNPDGTWRTVAHLAGSYDSRGHTEELSLVKVEKRKVGARAVLWLEVSKSIDDMWFDSDTSYTEDVTYVVLCTLPDAVCKHRFPITGDYSHTPVDDELEPTGAPESFGFRAELTLSPDGKANLRLLSGGRDGVEGFLGTHRIW